jgi:hypothetical protein
VVVWLAANALIVAVAPGTLPFDRPTAHGRSAADQVVGANLGLAEIFALMGIVYALTRRRTVPDVAARAPARAGARRETLLLVGYWVLGQLGGLLLAGASGWHAFSFHIVGTLFGTHQQVAPPDRQDYHDHQCVVAPVGGLEVQCLGGVAAAEEQVWRDCVHGEVVGRPGEHLESAFQLALLSSAILHLSARELLLGAPLTFALYFLGSVLPAMVFIYCILVPRYLRLTGAAATTVLLGGLSYMAVHFLDGWTVFSTPPEALLSVISLLLLYVGPGMFKTFLTLRTGNAWVHVWAYHALAPHTLEDTPLIVRIFRIG